MYFRGAGDQLSAAYYDTFTGRARFRVPGTSQAITFVPYSALGELDRLSVTVSAGADDAHCEVTISLPGPNGEITESWRALPRDPQAFAAVLAGTAQPPGQQELYDYAANATTTLPGAVLSGGSRLVAVDVSGAEGPVDLGHRHAPQHPAVGAVVRVAPGNDPAVRRGAHRGRPAGHHGRAPRRDVRRDHARRPRPAGHHRPDHPRGLGPGAGPRRHPGRRRARLHLRTRRRGLPAHQRRPATRWAPGTARTTWSAARSRTATSAAGCTSRAPTTGVRWALYRNGVLAGSAEDPTGAVPVHAGWSVGISAGGDRRFAGDLDDVRIWSATRSATDIADALGGRLSGTEKALAGYWFMSGGIFRDHTTGHQDGAPGGRAAGRGVPDRSHPGRLRRRRRRDGGGVGQPGAGRGRAAPGAAPVGRQQLRAGSARGAVGVGVQRGRPAREGARARRARPARPAHRGGVGHAHGRSRRSCGTWSRAASTPGTRPRSRCASSASSTSSAASTGRTTSPSAGRR